MLQGQMRIRYVDGVAGEKLDERERTVANEDKLLVLLHEISSFRDPLGFPALDVALADMSRRAQIFSEEDAVCLNRWKYTSIKS